MARCNQLTSLSFKGLNRHQRTADYQLTVHKCGDQLKQHFVDEMLKNTVNTYQRLPAVLVMAVRKTILMLNSSELFYSDSIYSEMNSPIMRMSSVNSPV